MIKEHKRDGRSETDGERKRKDKIKKKRSRKKVKEGAKKRKAQKTIGLTDRKINRYIETYRWMQT